MWAKRVYLIDSARIPSSARLYQPLVRVDIKFIVESLIISWYVSSRVVSHSLYNFSLFTSHGNNYMKLVFSPFFSASQLFFFCNRQHEIAIYSYTQGVQHYSWF